MKRRYGALALIILLQGAAVARQIPVSGSNDMRMRSVAYDPSQVVRLSTILGSALVVSFAASEKVTAVAVTDSKNLAAMPRDNFLFLKSRDALPSQPVIVLTKGPHGIRRYVFEFEAISAARQVAEHRDIYYSVEFKYPADRAQALLAAQRRRALEFRARLAQIEASRARKTLNETTRPQAQPRGAAQANWRYVAQGNRMLVPDIIYDDGYSTFFHFRGNTRMPAIFRIAQDGKETTVNTNVKNDWIVVGMVATGWHLRDGRTNLTIWNRAYDPIGHSPSTGTASRAVRRVMKGNQT
jgi:type IV secretion system protein VirB9